MVLMLFITRVPDLCMNAAGHNCKWLPPLLRQVDCKLRRLHGPAQSPQSAKLLDLTACQARVVS